MAIENLWHGSDAPHAKLRSGRDGGVHVGTRSQAEMRNAAFVHRVSAIVDVNRIVRAKDTGGGWAQKIKRARQKGQDAIVYLNRWEGISTQNGANTLDALSDAQFRTAVPEAQDSLIVLDESSLIVREVLLGTGRITLYHGTTEENARELIEKGFDPKNWRRGGNCGRAGFLYLTDDPMNAHWFGQQSGSGVVLEFRPRACDLIVDPEDGVHDSVVDELRSDMPAFLASRKPIPPHLVKMHPLDFGSDNAIDAFRM